MKAAILARVSTKDQSFQRQVDDLTAYATKQGLEIVEVYTEKITGIARVQKRVTLGKMLEDASIGKFQKLLVAEVSRIGRNTLECLTVCEKLSEYGVSIYIQNFNLETIVNGKRNPIAQMMLTMLAEFARVERENMIDRVKSGISKARKEGKHLGRPIGTVKKDDQLRTEYKPVLRSLRQGISLRKVAKIHNVSVNTVRKVNALVGK